MAYNAYGQPVQPVQSWGQPMTAYPSYQQSYASAPMQMSNSPVPQKPIMVDGEMAARVFQMPDNWPPMVPLYLWDVSGNVFYIKMLDANGIPLPLQGFDYNRREMTSGYISGASQPQVDMSQFVTKADFEQLRADLLKSQNQNQSGRNQNGSNNNQNRGGNQ